MEQHIKIVAWLNIVFGGVFMILGAVIFIVVSGAGVLSGDWEAMTMATIVGGLIGVFFMIISVPGVIGGIGLLQKKEWARILCIILAFFDLINFPFGTALGAYTLWVLFNQESIQIFAGTFSTS